MPLKKRATTSSVSSSSSDDDDEGHVGQPKTSTRRHNAINNAETSRSSAAAADGSYEEEEAQFSDDAHSTERRRSRKRKHNSSSSSSSEDDQQEDDTDDEKQPRTPSKRLITRSRKQSRLHSSPARSRRQALTELKQQKTAHSTGSIPRTQRRIESSSSSSDEEDDVDNATTVTRGRSKIPRRQANDKKVERTLHFDPDSDIDDIVVSDNEGESGEDSDAYISHNIMDREIQEREEFEARQEGLGISRSCMVTDTSGLSNAQSFDIYCRFLAVSIIYPGVFRYLRTMSKCKDSELYAVVKKRVDERLLAMRGSLLGSSSWNEELTDVIKRKSVLRIDEVNYGGRNCEVCRRNQRPSRFRMSFRGFTYYGPYLWDSSLSRPNRKDFELSEHAKSVCFRPIVCDPGENKPRQTDSGTNVDTLGGEQDTQTISDESSDTESDDNEEKYTRIRKRADQRNQNKRWIENGHIQKRGFDGAIELDDSDEEEWDASSDSEPTGNNNSRMQEGADRKAQNEIKNKLYWEDFIPRMPPFFKEMDKLPDVDYASGKYCRTRVQLFHNFSHFKLNLLDSLRQCIHQELMSTNVASLSNEWKEVIHEAFCLSPFYLRLAEANNFPPAPPLEVLYTIFESEEWEKTWRPWFNTYNQFTNEAYKFYATSTGEEKVNSFAADSSAIFENEITKDIPEFPVFEGDFMDSQEQESSSSEARQWLEKAKAMESGDSDEEGDVGFGSPAGCRKHLSQQHTSSQDTEGENLSTNEAEQSTERRQRSLCLDNETSDDSATDRAVACGHSADLQTQREEATYPKDSTDNPLPECQGEAMEREELQVTSSTRTTMVCSASDPSQTEHKLYSPQQSIESSASNGVPEVSTGEKRDRSLCTLVNAETDIPETPMSRTRATNSTFHISHQTNSDRETQQPKRNPRPRRTKATPRTGETRTVESLYSLSRIRHNSKRS